MPLTPIITIHLSLAPAAVAIGPVALWSRLGSTRPRLHRSMSYAWVTCMTGATSASIATPCNGYTFMPASLRVFSRYCPSATLVGWLGGSGWVGFEHPSSVSAKCSHEN